MKKLFLLFMLFLSGAAAAQFKHPGIDQSAADLARMKSLVLAGTQPYRDAFDRMKNGIDLQENIKAFAHVLRGPYARPNIGGGELSKGANAAYDAALVWYVTGDRRYADHAIRIINTWAATLWDFDYNDAKLLAAWTGHQLCNAAEILRYSKSGWKQQDMDQFRDMLMTVYYPLIRFYYPQANGNWDGAIIHSIIAMGVYLDDKKMFDNAVEHFLHGPVNGSIFKYIYPSGQCQETMRDQGHVQLGLGEFAGAAQVALTQGTDLFSIGNNRIGWGFEYTARFLLGDKPHSYGTISERAKTLRDDYEYVYRHYRRAGILFPHVQRAADSVRAKAGRSVLVAVRDKPEPGNLLTPALTQHLGIVGAGAGHAAAPDGAIVVNPGGSVQQALDKAAGGKRVVLLKAGIHTLDTTLLMPSGVTLTGEGLQTVLHLNPSGGRDAIVNASADMSDVTISNLLLEGSLKTDPGTDPNGSRSFRSNAGNRGGVIFRAQQVGQMKRLRFENITLQNCTFNGLLISGAEDVTITGCNFSENGGGVVPGPKLQHNVFITHSRNVTMRNNRSVTSPFGCGIALLKVSNAAVDHNEVARNGFYGILVTESDNVRITDNLVEANDRSGVMLEYLYRGSSNVLVSDNQIQYNNGFGLESYATSRLKQGNNLFAGNGRQSSQQKISNEKFIVME
ncbi:MAG: right-handed parallel beta-helix repeat-containing protein [Chitinophaga sp.]